MLSIKIWFGTYVVFAEAEDVAEAVANEKTEAKLHFEAKGKTQIATAADSSFLQLRVDAAPAPVMIKLISLSGDPIHQMAVSVGTEISVIREQLRTSTVEEVEVVRGDRILEDHERIGQEDDGSTQIVKRFRSAAYVIKQFVENGSRQILQDWLAAHHVNFTVKDLQPPTNIKGGDSLAAQFRIDLAAQPDQPAAKDILHEFAKALVAGQGANPSDLDVEGQPVVIIEGNVGRTPYLKMELAVELANGETKVTKLIARYRALVRFG